ncbi:MAG: hypothetical protein COU90_03790 [Candidatus Ryanbacteria bacterium CG10_big_fil_rev_8_21_14_0_10_43_42]|uniref:Uncharacterized protein n=1 Tax=Candidatus Ryanbacteria bacterium CG10_big_fil_rev_8_21_14_0_10_43_42 TaxID=1974864 RepID=A0A2M8KWE0_9BACT|nr:MAG: hypothetical protein COU90_03790 [Candidatus Ryanbacteria bacterium CG10_big_fil_rev_8_21_14_0_10_43_42]
MTDVSYLYGNFVEGITKKRAPVKGIVVGFQEGEIKDSVPEIYLLIERENGFLESILFEGTKVII